MRCLRTEQGGQLPAGSQPGLKTRDPASLSLNHKKKDAAGTTAAQGRPAGPGGAALLRLDGSQTASPHPQGMSLPGRGPLGQPADQSSPRKLSCHGEEPHIPQLPCPAGLSLSRKPAASAGGESPSDQGLWRPHTQHRTTIRHSSKYTQMHACPEGHAPPFTDPTEPEGRQNPSGCRKPKKIGKHFRFTRDKVFFPNWFPQASNVLTSRWIQKGYICGVQTWTNQETFHL